MSPWEAALFGIAIGYEHTDIDTGFNRGNVESDGFTIAPYAGFLLDDLLSVDATLGYTRIDVDQFRTDPASGARITSGTISDRWFASANMNLFRPTKTGGLVHAPVSCTCATARRTSPRAMAVSAPK
ncbi:MAG: autotransporter outer membrane beta-barrel domain-containing protein [Gammaproteobacteria bacterium]|nr:autotransporter outer membrane beta-barrel domain-containing protein [Gammaproteobacteria bacterium]